MTRILTHRGPDDEGLYFADGLGLGFRRLSILDLSRRGHQPMCSGDGRHVIVFNGEIYNYLELRRLLREQGYAFQSDGDTEVILALYARKGVECPKYLDGMFAFAIWDSVERTLFLARDRVGIKPLYYAETRDGVVFASEIKSLLKSEQLLPRVDTSKVDTFLSFGYVPGPQTMFRDVKKVMPGEWLRINSKGIHSGLYWDLNYQPNYRRSVQDTGEELRSLLLDVMRRHMRSDVPLGAFLSGGLDSSTTIALLAEAGIEGLNTFSVAHPVGGEYDESEYARLVARRFHTNHHVLYVDPTEFVDFIPHFVWYMDEPVAEAPGIALYFISKLLRQHVTVALSGEGSDELFAGYSVYRYMRWLDIYRRLPESGRSLLERMLEPVATDKLRRYLFLARYPLDHRYRGVSNYDPTNKDLLYTRECRDALVAQPSADPLSGYYTKTRGQEPLTQMLYADLKTWLPDDILIKADKMTMANSVELRVPFLDHHVVEYSATIPSSMKIRYGVAKWILKRAMKHRLPNRILTRRKLGFPTPIAAIFEGSAPSYVRDLLLSSRALERGYFRRDAIENLIDENTRKQKDHHRILWQLVVLEEWHRQFIDHAGPTGI